MQRSLAPQSAFSMQASTAQRWLLHRWPMPQSKSKKQAAPMAASQAPARQT
jgi:hypothetical protein